MLWKCYSKQTKNMHVLMMMCETTMRNRVCSDWHHVLSLSTPLGMKCELNRKEDLPLLFLTLVDGVIKIYFLVSRSEQGRQRESSAKALRSPLSTEFRRHWVLFVGTQRRALPERRSSDAFTVTRLCLCTTTILKSYH